MSMASPRHVSQFVHPSSPAPPQSPIYTSQTQYMSHTGSPIPARSPVLARRPPSADSLVQDNQQTDMHSGMNFNQDSYNNSNNSGSGGRGGGGVSFVNTIPIPEEFVRLGIKPGLLGGSPAWNEKCENNETKKPEENVKCTTADESETPNSGTSSKASATVTSSQLYGAEEDADYRDSPLFASYPAKLTLKQKSPSSPIDSDGNYLYTTPKTEDSMELPMYKDVPLVESCKSEENSLGIEDFPSHIEDSEMPLVLESDGLHLALDSSDVRSEDLLDDCLVSSDLLVLNVSGEHDGIMDDTSEIGRILYMDKMDGELHKQEGLIITEIKSEEGESEAETNVDTSSEPKQEMNETSCTESAEPVTECKSENQEDGAIGNANPSDPPAIEDGMVTEPIEENLVPTTLVNSVTSSSLPIRTTSVLQMTSSFMHSSAPKEASVTYSNSTLPIYIENFHSYVKKLPKSAENAAVAALATATMATEESNFEKDKQLFDETLMKMKTEKLTAEMQEEAPPQDRTSPAEEKRPAESESPAITTAAVTTTTTAAITTTSSGVPSTDSNPIATKDTKVVAVANSSPPKKESSPTLQVPHTSVGLLIPRARPSEDTQNVLLKQLLQNSGNSSITHSTMTQHLAKPPPVPSPTYRSPPMTTAAEVCAPATNQTTVTETVAVAASSSDTLVVKSEVSLTSSDYRLPSYYYVLDSHLELSFQDAPTSSKESRSTTPVSSQSNVPEPAQGPVLNKNATAVLSTASVTSSAGPSIPRTQFMTVHQMTLPTTAVKQEPISSTTAVVKKDLMLTIPSSSTSSSGPVVTPTSSMSPMHIEIKKESMGDELASPQPRAVDAGDTPNSISGDSSSGSLLDAQG